MSGGPDDLSDLLAARRAKLARLREAGVEPFPHEFDGVEPIASVLEAHAGLAAGEETAVSHRVAGRLSARRDSGRAAFLDVVDRSGRIQLHARVDELGEEGFDRLVSFDIGDLLGVDGVAIRTRRGELSLRVTAFALLAKSLRPPPDDYHGLSDIETRFRRRELDLIANAETREAFIARARIIAEVRRALDDDGFIEVETPVLQPLYGGGVARPFVTHHNTLDRKLYLRIAPELYLKRLVVGGLEKVFEINRNFRNEGISTRHNPEFTMLEFYEAYRDYHYLMDLTEELIRSIAQKVTGSTTVTYQGDAIDLGKPFDRLTMAQAIHRYNAEFAPQDLARVDFLRGALQRLGGDVLATDGLGVLQLKLFEATTEEKLVQPTFIIAHPTDVSPLARANDANPTVTDRFELFITRREIANGFSELNDPEDQAARFAAQVAAKDAGDEEAMHYDTDYVRALEYGLPPTAGEGIGIDRLVMLLTDAPSIRDVILFPQLKREQ